jgi:cytochrome P450
LQLRTAAEEVELDEVRFPAGTRLVVSQWVMHRLPALWKDPEVFRPERWDPASGEQIIPGTYFPFGGGPRICIGMPFAQLEAKLVLATVLQKFQPQVPASYQPGFLPVITLRPKEHVRARLFPAATTNSSTMWDTPLQSAMTNDELERAARRGCRSALFDMFGLMRL